MRKKNLHRLLQEIVQTERKQTLGDGLRETLSELVKDFSLDQKLDCSGNPTFTQ